MKIQETYINYLIQWIKDKVNDANVKGVIVGLSGGIDSALVAALAKKAFPNNSLALIMEIFDMGIHKKDAIKVAEKIGIKVETINLTIPYISLINSLNIKDNLAKANTKSRLRMTSIYAYAQELNYLVLGTDNAAEFFLGYFTKYGDGAADLLPIVNLTKRNVYEASKILNIPNEIIEKRPTAGLWENQYDEDELGFSYNEIDDFLENKEISKETLKKINVFHQKSKHKRHAIPKPTSVEDFLENK